MTDNELIAQFMGLVRLESDATYNLPQYYRPEKDKRKKGSFVGYPDQLKYATSWDWLMPVVEKIAETHDFTIQFYDGNCNCFCAKQNFGASDIPGVGHGGFKPHIQSVYKSVVALIKHINKS